MSVVLFYTKRVRETLKAPTGILADLTFLALVGGVVGALLLMGKQATARRVMDVAPIDLHSAWALLKYTLMSLSRGFAAYFLSLVFTLAYATYAAHNRYAEKLMIPALDVLQSIPVLSFLPTVVLAMMALFPGRELGLEVACVVMIFTGQAWNTTFSMYGSIKSLPVPLREAAQVYRLGRWRVFRLLELPASMIGLVWNSMMSMAGGWFVLTISEAFPLGDQKFRLPGIGSYTGAAIDFFNPQDHATWWPITGAIIAMVAMIVVVDQFFWRPIVVWSERFKMEETAETDKPKSWVVDLLAQSSIYHWLRKLIHARREGRVRAAAESSARLAAIVRAPAMAGAATSASADDPAASGGNGNIAGATNSQLPQRRPPAAQARSGVIAKTLATWLVVAALIAISVVGLWSLAKLLIALPVHDPVPGPVALLHEYRDSMTKLKLDGDQKPKVDALFSDAETRIQAIVARSNGNEEKARTEAKSFIDGLTEKLQEVMTDDQHDQLAKLHEGLRHHLDWLHVLMALGASLLRTSASILIGAAWTLPVGILIGLSPKWSQRLQPIVQVVASFPSNIVFPLITLFLVAIHFPFTIGCIALMLLGTQWYILFNVIAGAMAIPGDLKEVQQVFGTGWVKRWTRLYIPCVLPFLITGLITAAGGAWNATIVSEYVSVKDTNYIAFGIGSIINQASSFPGNFPLLAAATVSLALCVVLLNRLFWKKLYRKAEERFSLNV